MKKCATYEAKIRHNVAIKKRSNLHIYEAHNGALYVSNHRERSDDTRTTGSVMKVELQSGIKKDIRGQF